MRKLKGRGDCVSLGGGVLILALGAGAEWGLSAFAMVVGLAFIFLAFVELPPDAR